MFSVLECFASSLNCRWANKLSNKLFVARKFVVKHIRTKHEEKLQAQKEQVCGFGGPSRFLGLG
jgi:hypothetical protein